MLISINCLLDSNIPLLISAQLLAANPDAAIAAAPTPINSGSQLTSTPAPLEWMTSRLRPFTSLKG